jgi:hypothetical protein
LRPDHHCTGVLHPPHHHLFAFLEAAGLGLLLAAAGRDDCEAAPCDAPAGGSTGAETARFISANARRSALTALLGCLLKMLVIVEAHERLSAASEALRALLDCACWCAHEGE